MIKILVGPKKVIKEKDEIEADQMALKRLTPEEQNDPRVKRLIKLGLIPVIRARKVFRHEPTYHTSELGAGQNGTAYDTTKNGKRFVAKFTNDNNELEIRLAVERIRDQLPPEVSKHIVKIYNIIRGIDQSMVDRNRGGSYKDTEHIIVMEPLVPMNKYEHNLLYAGTRGVMTKDKITAAFHNYELFLKCVMNAVDEHDILAPAIEKIHGLRDEIVYALQYSIKPTVDEYDFEEAKQEKRSYDDVNHDLTNDIVRLVAQRFIKDKDVDDFDPEDKYNIAWNKNFYSYLKYSIRDGIRELINSVGSKAKFTSFPEYTGKDLDLSDAPSQQASFIHAMEELRKHGIEWGDLHGDNVMIRPGTHEYVAADIGNFSLRGQAFANQQQDLRDFPWE